MGYTLAKDQKQIAPKFVALAQLIGTGEFVDKYNKVLTLQEKASFNRTKFTVISDAFFTNQASVGLTPLQIAALLDDVSAEEEILLAEGTNALARTVDKIDEVTDENGNSNGLVSTEIGGVTFVKGSTALHLAVTRKNSKVAASLLEQDQNNFVVHIINQKDNQGNTPLHIAAAHGNSAEIKLLVDKDANKAASNNLNQTPLVYAQTKNQKFSVEIEKALTPGINLDVNAVNSITDSISATYGNNSRKDLASGAQTFDDVSLTTGLKPAIENIDTRMKSVAIMQMSNAVGEQEKNETKSLTLLQIHLQKLALLTEKTRLDIKQKCLDENRIKLMPDEVEKLAAIISINTATNKIVAKITALSNSLDNNQQELKTFLADELPAYVDSIQPQLVTLGEDYATWQKVLFGITVGLVVIGLAMTVIGLVAEIAGTAFLASYGTAANAIFTGGAQGAIISDTAASLGGAFVGVSVVAPTYAGYKIHKNKTQGRELVERMGENMEAIIKPKIMTLSN